MSHRPYPSAERATRQLDRHIHHEPLSPFRQRLAEQAALGLKAAEEAMRPFVESLEQMRKSPRYGGTGRL
jgi:hypothetical protein